MPDYEYKTIALPRLIAGQRRRRQSGSEFVAAVVEDALNAQAREGWDYVGTQEFSAHDRAGLLGRVEVTPFVVMIFRRAKSSPAVEAPRLRAAGLSAPVATPRLLDDFGKG